MIKKICLFFLLPLAGYSQSLDVDVNSAATGNQYDTFRLDHSEITIGGNTLHFGSSGVAFSDYLGYGISPDYSTIAALQNAVQGARAYLLDTEGDTLTSYDTISLSYDDPSLAVFPLNSGSVLIRNNIANFTFYNPSGVIVTSGSESSQSKRGETITEVAMDPNSKTVLIYTPKIKRETTVGSQAGILQENHTADAVFYSDNRQIRFGGVSDNGQFVVLITVGEGTDDQVLILDRFGNKLNTISSGEDLEAAYLTEDADYIMVHSSRRALVYSTMNGERIGSTSFRSSLITARYFPEDASIIALSGSRIENTGIIKGLEFHAIHLDRREIAREELSGALGTSPHIVLDIQRRGSGSYTLVGASKVVDLRASF